MALVIPWRNIRNLRIDAVWVSLPHFNDNNAAVSPREKEREREINVLYRFTTTTKNHKWIMERKTDPKKKQKKWNEPTQQQWQRHYVR